MRYLLYLLAATVTLLVATPFIIPTRLVWTALVPNELKQTIGEHLSLTQLRGVPAQGSARIRDHRGLNSTLHWTLDSGSLMTGSIGIDFELAGDDHRLTGHMQTQGNVIEFTDLNGSAGASVLNPYLANYGLEATGELSLAGTAFTLREQRLHQATGDLHWQGGRVTRWSGELVDELHLPELRGQVSTIDRDIALTIRDAASGQNLIDLTLTPNGWITVSIRGWLFVTAGRPIPGNMAGEDIIIQVEQLMIPGLGGT